MSHRPIQNANNHPHVMALYISEAGLVILWRKNLTEKPIPNSSYPHKKFSALCIIQIFNNMFIIGSLSPRHGASIGCGWRVAANILKKQSRTTDKGWSSSLGVGQGVAANILNKKSRTTNKGRSSSLGVGHGVAVNILNKQSQTADKGWSSSLGVGRGANNSSP
jgi:hypothetical protein